jgi:tRNA threonylcarbamoyladenosine biosynthesis protein TsaB
MIVLGLDTSGYANAVGVVDDDRVLADLTFPARTDSLEQIVDNIDATLRKAGLNLEDVEGIGVGLGPGSWTGIRVGVTVGKILAFSTGKPVVGVPTLEALAYQGKNEAPLICAVISAGLSSGRTIYAAGYRTLDGNVKRISDYYVGDVKGLTVMLREPVVLVGTGAERYRQIIKEAGPSAINVKALEAAPGGAAVASLAARRLGRGESDDVLSLTPLYLKESTARAFVNRYSGNVRVRG